MFRTLTKASASALILAVSCATTALADTSDHWTAITCGDHWLNVNVVRIGIANETLVTFGGDSNPSRSDVAATFAHDLDTGEVVVTCLDDLGGSLTIVPTPFNDQTVWRGLLQYHNGGSTIDMGDCSVD